MADGLALSATAGLQVMARRCGFRTPLSPGVLLLNLLIHGYLDNTVKPRNSAKLAELVTAASGQAQLVIVPDREHADILLALARPLSWLAPVADDVDQFIRQHDCR